MLISCFSQKVIITSKESCKCDSIYDYSQPLSLYIDKDSNLVSLLNKVPFKHCLSISSKKIIRNKKSLNPLILNRDKLIGYINKKQKKYFYINNNFTNEEVLFDFNNNNTSWIMTSGHFKDYKIRLDEVSCSVDTLYIFKFDYLGKSLSENMYYSKIALTKNNFRFFEFTNGIKCTCLK